MPRFPVNFRRKSTATDDPNGSGSEPSFRVLERPNVGNGKSFDGGVRLSRATAAATNPQIHDLVSEDNLFAGLQTNRGSGSSNTTKTHSDNSSRHSNASTAPSSAEYGPPQDEWRDPSGRKPVPQGDSSFSNIPPVPPVPKSSGFLKQAGRTFSFGANKKNTLPPIPADEVAPPLPDITYNPGTPGGRSRATTASTISTATPPKVEDRDFMLDLGGDLSSMLSKFDKRSSVATLKERDLTSNKSKQPSPLHLDRNAQVEPPPHSWNSQHSNDGLLEPARFVGSPVGSGGLAAPLTSPKLSRTSSEEDEASDLLNDSIAASRFLTTASGRQRKEEDRVPNFRKVLQESYADSNDDNMFDKSFSRPTKIIGSRMGNRSLTAPTNKVMTPKEFEKYRQDKANHDRLGYANEDGSDNDDEDVNYDDDEDELEKSKEVEKQRRKQEAQMSVYRQTMMKVTGESSNPRPTIAASMSTPNLALAGKPPVEESSEEDEEVPLAILAAHGFPNKNRPPTRLSNMPSQPDLRASAQQISASGGPSSTAGGNTGPGASGGRLPPFARKLPQDPYLGAGLINQPPRESMALGGGAPALPPPARPTTAGGLVGVIANEERARAMRRGSPAVDSARNAMSNMQMNPGFDHVNGIPAQMMYPMGMQPPRGPMLTPGDQAQMQMNQQMTQFMQMQMQFMQMMAQSSNPYQTPPQPMGHMPNPSVASFGDMSRNSTWGPDVGRNSYVGGPMSNGMSLDVPQSGQTRTMSMVQPSSASWIQPPQPNFLPPMQNQTGGYAPSIAPSERSNVGLPGRYRPVSSMVVPEPSHRTSTMGTSSQHLQSKLHTESKLSHHTNKDDDDDDEEGWEAMKAKREKKKSLWRSKKNFASDALEAITFN